MSPSATTRSQSETPLAAPRRPLSRSPLRWALQLADLVSLSSAWVFAWLVSGHTTTTALPSAVAVALGFVLCRTLSLYRPSVTVARAVAYTRLMAVAAASAAATLVVEVSLGDSGLLLPLGGGLAAFGLAATARYGFDWWLRWARADGRFTRRVTVFGCASEIRAFHGFLSSNPELGYEIVAAVGGDSDPGLEVPWYPRLVDARVAVTATESSGAIILGSGLPARELNEITRELTASHIPVQLHTGLQGVGYRRLRSTPLGCEPFLTVEPATESRVQLAAKRLFDVVGATMLLLLSAPVTLLAALAVKLQDGGSVLFTQSRVGRDGKPIRVHKLRTMAPDAESRLAEIRPLNERMGPLFKTEFDPRITRVGKILRRASIDEIPQLLDVLRGDMSLVGPRPALPEEVAAFDDALLARLRVRPGVTGLWQVEARDKPSFDAYRRLDLYYVENWSFFLDIAIVIDTVPAVVDHALRGFANFLRRRSEPSRTAAQRAPVSPGASVDLTAIADPVEP